ncbi:helicase-related protein [Thiobaca trueperi]|uniref:Helicase-like protein n=1 Tax=Thiobaca trueperi TaxID=127458 RepID=A0A4R3N2E9_9GAMM|nr:helicase-related protein [Thiobaca trueperi]TCT21223.1 helicase-like protein [Thiobaca trueperi]
MTLESDRERFVDWLAQRMTLAGRGDREDLLTVEPSGKYWLGRLQSAEAVIESDWGDRGERLEPCAFGIKVKPAQNGPWHFHVVASCRVWLWDKSERQWRKTNAADVRTTVDVPAQIGAHRFGEDEFARALEDVTGRQGLSARIDVDVEIGRSGDHELTISLVNCSPKEHSEFKDTRLYQCEMRLEGLEPTPFMLESLEDSFRYDRRVPAYGINCGVQHLDTGVFVTEDAVTVDRRRPHYWSVDEQMPTMRFDDLALDPISPAEALLSCLRRWGRANWAADILDLRAAEEDWSAEMRMQASKAAAQFEDECERLTNGIELLRSNERLLRAFQGMNRAMSHSANGKYDAWRPFQFGFLLANLRSIVDVHDESEIVDVVWFATGGGKTETYLGLLVTAALYDRLTGKVSGITAWSRFPLRMLSLQQTQRFADAIAAAELVRREMRIPGAPFSLGFFVGQTATPNRIPEKPKPGEADPDDDQMPARYQILEYCPFCHQRSIVMAFDRRLWKLEHRCNDSACASAGRALPVYVVDEEIYRFLPTIVVGTLDKAASIAIQASMRGMVGAPRGVCSKEGHGYTYAPRSSRPSGCLVPGCQGTSQALPMDAERYGPSFRLQDELHLLRDSLGAVDSHYEALYDALQKELCGRKPKILASSATLTGYEKQVDVLYRRSARVFPVPPPRSGGGFWTSDSSGLMRRFIAIAPRGVTLEYTVDRLLTELQIALRGLAEDPVSICAEIGVDPSSAGDLLSLYGTNVVYGNTLRDLEAVMRSMETQVIVPGQINTATLTGKTDFGEVREILERLQSPEAEFEKRLHIISASSMMSHGVDVDRLNVMVMLGIPLSAAEFIQATARVGRRYPGIVFVVHKIGRERDAGVYRSFPQFIAQGDRFVEPIPVTKRSRRVLDRTIAGLELARLLMIHEAVAGMPLTTVQAFKQYVASGRFDFTAELEAMQATLELQSDLDEPLKRDLAIWFEELRHNVSTPPNDARFPSDLSPSGPPMLSLRDVEKQVPVIGTRV